MSLKFTKPVGQGYNLFTCVLQLGQVAWVEISKNRSLGWISHLSVFLHCYGKQCGCAQNAYVFLLGMDG
eukprot:6959267-Karenia_brevis.AAC.1